jgi:hypothetical protein
MSDFKKKLERLYNLYEQAKLDGNKSLTDKYRAMLDKLTKDLPKVGLKVKK